MTTELQQDELLTPTPDTHVSPETPPAASPDQCPVHPLAASFPLLEGEELDALVDDIRRNGLLNPIVRDKDGRIIDGRNRLRACELAKVQPTFTTTEVEPSAYILSANVTRRHLSKGQWAMAFATAYPEATAKGGRGKTAVSNTPVSGEYITKARFVLRHAPDLVAKVMVGHSLTDAYQLAAEQKKDREDYERLRNEVREQLDALITNCARLRAHATNPEPTFLTQDDFVTKMKEEIAQVTNQVAELADLL
jgi:hypothetical protein